MLYHEGGETLAQVAQRNCGYPIPASVQGQLGRGFEQLDLMGDQAGGLERMIFEGPF